LNGTSSATVALNLAYCMWPEKLYLFGFDMCRGPNDEAHWHPDYPWNLKSTKQGKLAEWAKEFASIYEEFKRKKIEVLNVSSRSRITVWKRYHPRELGHGEKVSVGIMREATLIMAYYENKDMLSAHYAMMRKFSKEVRKNMRVIVVDDGSPFNPRNSGRLRLPAGDIPDQRGHSLEPRCGAEYRSALRPDRMAHRDRY
jgi:hypothetical protein